MKYDRGIKSLSIPLTSDASGNLTTTTDPVTGIIQRVSLIEGTMSAQDWVFTLKDNDGFTVYTATITANTTVIPSKIGTAGIADFLYAVNSTCTITVSNGGNALSSTARVFYS